MHIWLGPLICTSTISSRGKSEKDQKREHIIEMGQVKGDNIAGNHVRQIALRTYKNDKGQIQTPT